jgi:hypothetical protein
MNVLIARHEQTGEICLKISDGHHVEVVDFLLDNGFAIHECEPYHFVKMAEEDSAQRITNIEEAIKFEKFVDRKLKP